MIKDTIQLLKGDITTLQVDAIVNAANTTLLGGGGVDGAIHRAAGKELVAECEKLGGCSTGLAKITKGYQLPAKYIIHTVGPVWHGGEKGEPLLWTSCYQSSLNLALEYDIATIAFPAISCGAYRFPIEQATRIAIEETVRFIELHNEIAKVIFVCFDEHIYQSYHHALESFNHE